MNDKICIITGASQGIGKATALGLARMGATVVLISHDPARGFKARMQITQISRNENVYLELADLSSISEVTDLAFRIAGQFPVIDVLINNHSALFDSYTLTNDGLEMNFALNHLAYFHLTNLLLENLKRARGRVINVSAQVHEEITHDFLDTQVTAETYNPWDAYCQAKLGNIMFTYALARRLLNSGVTVNCLYPGRAQTLALKTAREIYTRLNGPTDFVDPGTHEAAAETSIYLASDPDVQGVTGKYFEFCREVPSSELSYDVAMQEKLWQLSSDLTRLEKPDQERSDYKR